MAEQSGAQSSYDFFPDRRSIINSTKKEVLPKDDYVEMVTKYLRRIPNVCEPCTEKRVATFTQSPYSWAIRYPVPADVIAQIDEGMPCTHIQGNEDIIAKITARVAVPREVTVELVNG